MTATEIAGRLSAKKSGKGWMANCPAHEDRRASLSINEGEARRVLLNCHAGCATEAILSAIGLTWSDLQPDRAKSEIVATYPYSDEQGALLYEVVRFSPKDFRQRRPDGAGGWLWNLQGVRRVLYRLNRLPGSETVLIVEGEKDADALWALDLPASTSAGGAGKWLPDYVQQLKASGVQQIIVLPDNDDAGRAHAEAVAASCAGAGLAVRMLRLPDLPLKGDVSNYLTKHTKGDLVALLSAAPVWQPTQLASAPTDSRTATFNVTDSGNAEYFAKQHGESARYDHRRGRWLLWNRHRWQADADAEIRRRAKSSMRQRYRDAGLIDGTQARTEAAKWAIASESRSRLEALLYLAQAEPPIADAGDNWDADPMLLGVPNGVIDLRAGILRPGRHEDRITMSAAVPYDSQATCPRWERFVSEVFPDSALSDFIQRAIGYSLTGDTGEQCLFLSYGTGANGKGTFTNTLAAVLGEYAYTMPFSTVEMHQRASIPNDMAALVGRRFVGASETADGARLNESRLKALTGGDPITARFLHSEFFTFQPVAKFWLSVNHKPVVRDDSRGFWRRMRLIPFAQTFAVNPSLADELRAEAPGILAWAVRGCLAWQREGLNPPAIVLDATRDYERDSDPLAAFLYEACELDAEAETGARDLFEHYQRWAERTGMSERERLKSALFGRKVGERFQGEHTRAGKVYKGIARGVL